MNIKRIRTGHAHARYMVSVNGEVYSERWHLNFVPMKQKIVGGYLTVRLQTDPHYQNTIGEKHYKILQVHRIVAQAFLPDYTDDAIVLHIDGNIMNNKVSNLKIIPANNGAPNV